MDHVIIYEFILYHVYSKFKVSATGGGAHQAAVLFVQVVSVFPAHVQSVLLIINVISILYY